MSAYRSEADFEDGLALCPVVTQRRLRAWSDPPPKHPIQLVGRDCTRDAANARVIVHSKDAPPQMREVLLGSSYLSGHTKTLHFGVGDARRVLRLEVRWPCGRTQSIEDVPVVQTLKITETEKVGRKSE